MHKLKVYQKIYQLPGWVYQELHGRKKSLWKVQMQNNEKFEKLSQI